MLSNVSEVQAGSTPLSYIRYVKNFEAFLGRPPDTASPAGSDTTPACHTRKRRPPERTTGELATGAFRPLARSL
jgi:hypothetical protein